VKGDEALKDENKHLEEDDVRKGQSGGGKIEVDSGKSADTRSLRAERDIM